MGSKTCSCLVVIGVIVTILYATSSDCTGVTAENAADIKTMIHYDIMAVDNSKNDGETV